jgi:hypothetical protein
MTKRVGLAVLILALTAMVSGCMTLTPAPKTSSGKDIVMNVMVDRGIEKSFTDYQVKNRRQVGDWMEKDMSRLLTKAGYNARVISRRSDFRPENGSYLLVVRISNYNPGSKAARMFVGYGVGSASAQVHYELYGKGQKAMLDDDAYDASGNEWQIVFRKIDLMTANAVTGKLIESRH